MNEAVQFVCSGYRIASTLVINSGNIPFFGDCLPKRRLFPNSDGNHLLSADLDLTRTRL
jgi:hypothetical protein